MTRQAPDVTCQELVELVTDYFENALSPRERERFEAHVASCNGCVAHVRQLRTTVEMVGATWSLVAAPDASVVLALFRGSWTARRARRDEGT
jgi:anti-sigma factor RsiW